MLSPFPGMDPYLEGPDWSDFHNSLAYVIKKILAPQLTPYYTVRLEKYAVLDTDPLQNIGIIYPDVEVWQKPPESLLEPSTTYGSSPVLTPPTATLPFPGATEAWIPVIEIRDLEKNRLITSIEILSPVNKRNPGFEKYLKKQRNLHQKGVHLIEIDLLRLGRRTLSHPVAASAHYIISLLRGEHSQSDLWAVTIKDTLPTIPVPVKKTDADAVLDLQNAFNTVYEESFYGDAIDYEKDPPPPPFSPEQAEWIKARLHK